ncbi:MAG: two-component sensor histidine kinase [Oscillospiraceae bacterium]|nr:two-component sensor histidine kinase [Oscillospiraceae bacterium]
MSRKRSITEAINHRLLLLGLLTLVLTAALITLAFYRGFARQVEHDLERTARAAASGYALSGDLQVLEGFAEGELRITLIDTEGHVLYDSEIAGPMENHLQRPEVQQALAEGVGFAQRSSATLGLRSYYCALLLPEGGLLRLALDADSAYAFFDRSLPWVLLLCALIFAVSATASWLLTHSLVQPIVALGNDLDHIAERVPYRELVPFAEAIQTDQQMRRNSERMRREFTANVSHELKTPLTSISGYAELIEAGMVQPDDLPAFAGRIRTEAARLQALVADILQLSELDNLTADQPETGKPPEFQPVDLLAVVRRCADRLTLNAQRSYVTLLAEGESILVCGSARHLDELAYNLCDNAIRYNRPGGRVVLRAEYREGRPALCVTDDGIGIPPEHQSRIFERFYRVDKSRSKATGGTGLGLAIVKHIALMHSASIRLKSRPGEGTSITVLFPAQSRKS